MTDEEEIRCPFCKKADGCKHLLAAFDHGNAEIAGGILFDREEQITELVRKGFEALFVSRGPSVDWGHAPDFKALWEDCVWRRDNPEEEPLDSGLLALLLDDLLGDTDAIREEDGDVAAFFDPKPGKVCEQVVKVITHALEVTHE